MTQVVEAALDAFRRSFTGQLIAAPGADYDSARSLWNGSYDRRPAAVARCLRSADVAAAIAFARQQDLEISVRSGGDSVCGVSAADSSLMIDLSDEPTAGVDPAARRARCGGGTTGADLDAACQQYGLAVTTGTISHIGVAGLTLGGGLGWLRAMMGLSMDNLVGAEVVLADGRCIRASEDDHPDLFWALRGGGGNFGVVTNFEYRLQPVGPEVHVGLFFWSLDRSVEALRLCREMAADLPRDAAIMIAAGLSAPPAPFVPDEYHFTPGNALIVAGFSSAQQHKQLIDPIRAALPPLFEFVTPMPYTALQQMLDGAFPWGVHAYAESLFLPDLPDEAIDVLAERAGVGEQVAEITNRAMAGRLDFAQSQRERVAQREWYHTIELAPGVETPGYFDLREVAQEVLPGSLAGARCLDVKTFDGFWALELEKRGASEVVAIDILDPRKLDWPVGSDDSVLAAVGERKGAGEGFEIVMEALGKRIERLEMSVYELDPVTNGMFDFVYVGSLLLHLRDPVGALEAILRCLKPGGLLVQMEHFSIRNTLLSPRRATGDFQPLRGEFNWWLANLSLLKAWPWSAGFVDVRRVAFVRPPSTSAMRGWYAGIHSRRPA